jgi:hypothetical protein
MMREARGGEFAHVGGDSEEEGSFAPHSRGGDAGGIAFTAFAWPVIWRIRK